MKNEIEKRSYIPYVYLIVFLPTGQYYGGVEHKKGAHPDNIWTKYFTSSKVIKKLIAEYGKEAFKVLLTIEFETKEEALRAEEKALKGTDAARSDEFLNKHNGGKGFYTTPESAAKSAAGRNGWIKNNPEAYVEIITKATTASNEWRKNNPEAFAKLHKKTIDGNKEWRKKNPDKVAEIAAKGTAGNKEWRKKNPDKVAEIAAKMTKSRTSNTEEFIAKAKSIHGDLYDYLAAEYKNSGLKIKIICSKHGVFEQRPSDHLSGAGCNQCGIEKAAAKTSEFWKNNPEAVAAKTYKIIFPDGTEIIIKNLTHFCRNYFQEGGIKLGAGCLVEVAKGKLPHHKGFKCEYVIGSCNDENQESLANIAVKQLEWYKLHSKTEIEIEKRVEGNAKISAKCSKTYKIIFPGGVIKIIKGLTKFCHTHFEETGIKLDAGSLIKVAKGKLPHYKGFKCEYYTE